MTSKCCGLFRIMMLIISVTLASGCTTPLRNKQLASVAKDWCYVVRASQVIPVYPLTEDLQPGDVMLVSTPVEEQVHSFADKGFLPLDQLVKRLNPDGFKEFYRDRYGCDAEIPPSQWQKMVDANGVQRHAWDRAPHAAFPSYSFTVSSGGGLNLAVPIQGVPVGLGLMHSGKASGSLVIGSAYTFGLDNLSLYEKVKLWAVSKRELLRPYAPRLDQDGKKQYHFLRVVSRVYAVGDVNITMVNDEATSGDFSGGADKPVPLVGVKEGASFQNLSSVLNVVNAAAEKQLPGGRLKFAAASNRSVSMNERFNRPLIIGYVGFDVPILEGGRLGSPISTLSQLTGIKTPEPQDPGAIPYRLAALAHMNRALNEMNGSLKDEIRKKLDALGLLLPETYPFTLYVTSGNGAPRKDSAIISGSKVTKRNFTGVLDFINNGRNTISALEPCIATAVACGGVDQALALNEVKAARESGERMLLLLGEQPALAEAIDFVFLGD